jgi:hypothetical protein
MLTLPRVLYLFVVAVAIVSVVDVEAQQGVNHTTATLSEARWGLASTSSGELVFFGGGQNTTGKVSDRVDILNVSSGIWTSATLSQPRRELAATSSGNLVFFGGGWNQTTFSDRVDIYNTSSGSWSTATLSQPRAAVAATSIGDLVLFGGSYNTSIGASDVVDVYNEFEHMDNCNSESSSSLSRSNISCKWFKSARTLCWRI